MSKQASQTPSNASRVRLVIACVLGGTVIFAGSFLPRLLKLPQLSETTPETVADVRATPELLPTDIRPIVERVLVAGSIVFLIGVIGWWSMKRSQADSSATLTGFLNVRAALPLPYSCCAFLIAAGDRQFLAGVDASGVRTILPLPAPPEREEVVAPVRLEVRA